MLVDSEDWQSAIAAAVLAGPPIGAPLLLSDGDELPAVTADTLERLEPKGSDLSKDAQVIRIGEDVARPDGFKTAVVQGDDPFERAAAIDRFVSAARGKPSADVVLYSADSPEWALPAASWAARSGDAALPVKRDSIPAPVRRALARPRGAERVPARAAERDLARRSSASCARRKLAGLGQPHRRRARRWRTRSRSPATRRATSAGGSWCPATTSRSPTPTARSTWPPRPRSPPAACSRRCCSPTTPPSCREPLESYLLSVQPGYEDDPGQAVYNRAWILGDDKAISVDEQARIDATTELIPVQSNAP